MSGLLCRIAHPSNNCLPIWIVALNCATDRACLINTFVLLYYLFRLDSGLDWLHPVSFPSHWLRCPWSVVFCSLLLRQRPKKETKGLPIIHWGLVGKLQKWSNLKRFMSFKAFHVLNKLHANPAFLSSLYQTGLPAGINLILSLNSFTLFFQHSV